MNRIAAVLIGVCVGFVGPFPTALQSPSGLPRAYAQMFDESYRGLQPLSPGYGVPLPAIGLVAPFPSPYSPPATYFQPPGTNFLYDTQGGFFQRFGDTVYGPGSHFCTTLSNGTVICR